MIKTRKYTINKLPITSPTSFIPGDGTFGRLKIYIGPAGAKASGKIKISCKKYIVDPIKTMVNIEAICTIT